MLAKLRRSDPAFRTVAYVPIESGDPSVFAFARRNADGSGAMVVANVGPARRTARPQGLGSGVPQPAGATCASGATLRGLTLAPWDTCIVRFRTR